MTGFEKLPDLETLQSDVERLTSKAELSAEEIDESVEVVAALRVALRAGSVRAAEQDGETWSATAWVKAGIVLAFRVGVTREYRPFQLDANVGFAGDGFRWSDRHTLPLHPVNQAGGHVRVVPGGSSVRDGVYLGQNVVIMPPAYINIGAYVDDSAMIDSHALVGSCAQVGKRVHLSAGAQLGGVLEPIGLRPVIIEDDALVGGNAGVFEGTLVREGAVIAPGVQLTRSIPVYDVVRETLYRGSPDEPLTIPARAVVVPGTRPASGSFAEANGLHLAAPVIVKYRDADTNAATALEEALR